MAVLVYVNSLQEWMQGLRVALDEQLQSMGTPAPSIPLHEVAPSSLPPRTVVLYFSDRPQPETGPDDTKLREHINAGHVVIPVVDTLHGAQLKVPSCLRSLNAFALGTVTPNYIGLVHEILDRLWHARLTRKVFISYRRDDSSAIAHQLRDRLSARGYDVFLDEASIRPGADFQRELMAWLVDADFVLLLASPGLANSQWVVKEIEFANFTYVGILALCWPDARGPRPAAAATLMEDQILTLQDAWLLGRGSPRDETLSAEAETEIIARIDRYRARFIALRLGALLPFLRTSVDRTVFDVQDGDRLGDVLLTRRDTRQVSHVRVLPFRPTAATVHDLYEDLREAQAPAAASCFYFETDVSEPHSATLAWILEPERPEAEAGPRRYHLIPYAGLPLNLGVLP